MTPAPDDSKPFIVLLWDKGSESTATADRATTTFAKNLESAWRSARREHPECDCITVIPRVEDPEYIPAPPERRVP